MYVIMEVMKMDEMDRKQIDHLVNIYRVMNQKTFGFRFSATIVGGRTRLQRLIEKGEIRTEKKSVSQNGKLYCNASDVLRYAVA
ncbi:hypothetical protein SAMN05444350_11260 [Bacteroides stercorirosoris]|jgi:hypothetical protein|uniref:Uncharacterized protein n=2 Tax=Bacteroides stercorirosoris TaxID=871324 RepID=A0A1M6FJB8_9BACE|nr:hypothetical protein SAMN05444350_11260 [Bacteroides stercorirosoris]